MSYLANQENYGSLIEEFLASKIDAGRFETAFLALWKQDRDEEWAKKNTWPEPYDEHLQAALRKGLISKDEFAERWRKLWGYRSAQEVAWLDMLNDVFSACDAYVADPGLRTDPELDYDDDKLRSAVSLAWTSFRGTRAQLTSSPTMKKV